MTQPSNLSLKGIVTWAEDDAGPGAHPPNNQAINAHKLDGNEGEYYAPAQTNINLSKIGSFDYFDTIDAKTDFRGAAFYGTTPYILKESDTGNIVGLRSGTNYYYHSTYYFKITRTNPITVESTDIEYRPPFLGSNETVEDIIDGNKYGFFASIRNRTTNAVKYYWVHTNGTMDKARHTYVDVSSIASAPGFLSVVWCPELECYFGARQTNNTLFSLVWDKNLNLLQEIESFNIITDIDWVANNIVSYAAYRSSGIIYKIEGSTAIVFSTYSMWIRKSDNSTFTRDTIIKLIFDKNTGVYTRVFNPNGTPYTNLNALPFSTSSNYSNSIRIYEISDTEYVATKYLTDTHYATLRYNPTSISTIIASNISVPPAISSIDYLPDDTSFCAKQIRKCIPVWDANTNQHYSIVYGASKTYGYSWGVIEGIEGIQSITDIYPLSHIDPNNTINGFISYGFNAGGILRTHIYMGCIAGGPALNNSNIVKYESLAQLKTGQHTIVATLPANTHTQLQGIITSSSDYTSEYTDTKYLLFYVPESNLFIMCWAIFNPTTKHYLSRATALTRNGDTFTVGAASEAIQGSSWADYAIFAADRPSAAIFKNGTDIYMSVSFPARQYSGGSTYYLGSLQTNTSASSITLNKVVSSPTWYFDMVAIHPQYGLMRTYTFFSGWDKYKVAKGDYKNNGSNDLTSRMISSFTNPWATTVTVATIRGAVGFKLHFPVLEAYMIGKYRTSNGIQTLDLKEEFPNDYKNNTFYLYAVLVDGKPKIIAKKELIGSSRFQIRVGKCTTDNVGITYSEVNKPWLIDDWSKEDILSSTIPDDSNLVHKTGAETITGVKDFAVAPRFIASSDVPFTVTSNQKVNNLNSDMVDGHHAGNAAGNVLVLGADGKVPSANLPTLTSQGYSLYQLLESGETYYNARAVSSQFSPPVYRNIQQLYAAKYNPHINSVYYIYGSPLRTAWKAPVEILLRIAIRYSGLMSQDIIPQAAGLSLGLFKFAVIPHFSTTPGNHYAQFSTQCIHYDLGSLGISKVPTKFLPGTTHGPYPGEGHPSSGLFPAVELPVTIYSIDNTIEVFKLTFTVGPFTPYSFNNGITDYGISFPAAIYIKPGNVANSISDSQIMIWVTWFGITRSPEVETGYPPKTPLFLSDTISTINP